MKAKKLFLVVAIFFACSNFCRVSDVSENKFFSAINRTRLGVVLFFRQADKHIDREAYQWFKELKRRMHAVSENRVYRYADVRFFVVSLQRDSELAGDFVPPIGQRPTIVLFHDGIPASKARLIGDFTEIGLNRFVDEYLGDIVDETVRQKNERENELIRSGYYAGFGGWHGGWYGWYGPRRVGWGPYWRYGYYSPWHW